MRADREVRSIKIKIIFGKMHDALMHPISKVVGVGEMIRYGKLREYVPLTNLYGKPNAFLEALCAILI